VLCLTNFGDEPVSLPDGDVIISSGPLDDGRVPTDITVWLRLPTGHDR
jgi:alpha-glucosidase